MAFLFFQKTIHGILSITFNSSLVYPICFIWLCIEQCASNASAREKTIECARACFAQYGWLLPITLVRDEIRFNNVLYTPFIVLHILLIYGAWLFTISTNITLYFFVDVLYSNWEIITENE